MYRLLVLAGCCFCYSTDYRRLYVTIALCYELLRVTVTPSLPWHGHMHVTRDGASCVVLLAISTAPVTPVHRSKASMSMTGLTTELNVLCLCAMSMT